MASTLYLTRKNGRYIKYADVSDLLVTGTGTAYGGVTGAESTDVITITGATPVNGQQITFTSLTGGAGLAANRVYFIRDATGSTCKVADTPGGAAVNFTTDITAATATIQLDEISVWSSEFRDVFQTSASGNVSNAYDAGGSASMTVPGQVTSFVVDTTFDFAGGDVTSTPTISSQSDDAAHVGLRQTRLYWTFWKFDMGASVSPRYLYAQIQQGDAISTSIPNTP